MSDGEVIKSFKSAVKRSYLEKKNKKRVWVKRDKTRSDFTRGYESPSYWESGIPMCGPWGRKRPSGGGRFNSRCGLHNAKGQVRMPLGGGRLVQPIWTEEGNGGLRNLLHPCVMAIGAGSYDIETRLQCEKHLPTRMNVAWGEKVSRRGETGLKGDCLPDQLGQRFFPWVVRTKGFPWVRRCRCGARHGEVFGLVA